MRYYYVVIPILLCALLAPSHVSSQYNYRQEFKEVASYIYNEVGPAFDMVTVYVMREPEFADPPLPAWAFDPTIGPHGIATNCGDTSNGERPGSYAMAGLIMIRAYWVYLSEGDATTAQNYLDKAKGLGDYLVYNNNNVFIGSCGMSKAGVGRVTPGNTPSLSATWTMADQGQAISFLTELYEVSGDSTYLQAAERIADFSCDMTGDVFYDPGTGDWYYAATGTSFPLSKSSPNDTRGIITLLSSLILLDRFSANDYSTCIQSLSDKLKDMQKTNGALPRSDASTGDEVESSAAAISWAYLRETSSSQDLLNWLLSQQQANGSFVCPNTDSDGSIPGGYKLHDNTQRFSRDQASGSYTLLALREIASGMDAVDYIIGNLESATPGAYYDTTDPAHDIYRLGTAAIGLSLYYAQALNNYTVEGKIFEDLPPNLGADFIPGEDSPLENVTVMLCGVSGGNCDCSIIYDITITDSNGDYILAAPGPGDYCVKVETDPNWMEPSAGLNPGYTVSDVKPEQTVECTSAGNCYPEFGGDDPLAEDDNQVIVTVSSSVTGVNMGFNFEVIVNTNDSGQGSLRQFIQNSNAIAGPNLSRFMIPITDPNYNPLTGIWTISPLSPLPDILDDDTTIDGSQQTSYAGDTNPDGPEIEIDGSASGADFGLYVSSANNVTIRELIIRNFTSGWGWAVQLDRADNCLIENLVVEDCNNGINLYRGSDNNIVQGCKVTGIDGNAISIYGSGDGCTGNIIRNNEITDCAGWTGHPYVPAIPIFSGANDNIVENNVIDGKGIGIGVALWGYTYGGNDMPESGNVIRNNEIKEFNRGIYVAGHNPNTNSIHLVYNITIESNVIINNSEDGIVFKYTVNNTIQGNYIGLDSVGNPAGNTGNGVSLIYSDNNIIGTDGDGTNDTQEGNVISDNSLNGIALTNSTRNVIAGNKIGTDIGGTSCIGNVQNGISLDNSSDNTIGTNGDGVSDSEEGNLISCNQGNGIYLSYSNNNWIAGNKIGTDIGGTSDLGNGNRGVALTHSDDNLIGTNGDGVSDSEEGNLISGNDGEGIWLDLSNNNWIAGNKIGTDIGGTSSLGNLYGIYLHESDDNLIGTNGDGVSDSEEGNLISGNSLDGIFIETSDNNVIAGNRIGVDSTGSPLGNGRNGILIGSGTESLRIGSDDYDSLESNVIAYNNGDGIALGDFPVDDPRLVTISMNSIFENSGLGIDICMDGPNYPSPGCGAQDNVPTPEITSVYYDPSTNQFTLEIDNLPPGNVTVELFKSTSIDPSNYGEGETFVSQYSVVGPGPTSITVPRGPGAGQIDVGDYISVTATDSLGNTSEFSRTLQIIQIVGTVYEDLPGDGIGDSYTPGIDSPLENVYVMLMDPTYTTLYTWDRTDLNGQFALIGVHPFSYGVKVLMDPNDPNYDVVIHSSILNPGFSAQDILPEQTYEDDGDCGPGTGAQQLGGDDPLVGNDNQLDSAITTQPGGCSGIEFGFSFEVIVNTKDPALPLPNSDFQGSLRQFIQNSNAIAGPNLSRFMIPTTDPNYNGVTWEIHPSSELPTITDDYTTIDGSQQTSYAGDTNPDGPEIEIKGDLAGASDGLEIHSNYNVISYLIINEFQEMGIRIRATLGGDYNEVHHCYIGTDETGEIAEGNGLDGIYLDGWAGNHIEYANIHDNVISGNGQRGLVLDRTSNSQVMNNYIGTDKDGESDLGNGWEGLTLWAPSTDPTGCTNNTIEGNIISGNDWYGIFVYYGTSNTIRNNYIGTNPAGDNLCNGAYGLILGTDDVIWNPESASNDNLIENNVIAYNGCIQAGYEAGVFVNSSSSGNTIRGNQIYSNVGDGVLFYVWTQAPTNNLIENNYIHSNGRDGIRLEGQSGAEITGNYIQGNHIGITGGDDLAGCINPDDDCDGLADEDFPEDDDGDGSFDEDPISIDDDGDGLIDEDPIDGIDNDGDGQIDEDPGYDDDGDGLIDEDPIDGIDNDGDGQIDEDPVTSLDDDCDGLIDEDPIDGIDNDGDGLTDEDPIGCTNPDDDCDGLTDEDWPRDDDGDGLINEDPIGCTNPDDDCDGLIDEDVAGNRGNGIYMVYSDNNIIGTDGDGTNDPQEGNVISGNVENGIFLSYSNNNVIAGNKIGIDENGRSIPNSGHGIYIAEDSSGNRIGSDDYDSSESNVIAYNNGDGIYIEGDDSDFNLISMNSFFENGELGIDLYYPTDVPPGVTPNDPGDVDTGPNENLNFPVITYATPAYAEGQAPPNSTVELYLAREDPSGHGEGMMFLGYTSADASGFWRIWINPPVGIAAPLTALAIDQQGNTSEFSEVEYAIGCCIDIEPNYSKGYAKPKTVCSEGEPAEFTIDVRNCGFGDLDVEILPSSNPHWTLEISNNLSDPDNDGLWNLYVPLGGVERVNFRITPPVQAGAHSKAIFQFRFNATSVWNQTVNGVCIGNLTLEVEVEEVRGVLVTHVTPKWHYGNKRLQERPILEGMTQAYQFQVMNCGNVPESILVGFHQMPGFSLSMTDQFGSYLADSSGNPLRSIELIPGESYYFWLHLTPMDVPAGIYQPTVYAYLADDPSVYDEAFLKIRVMQRGVDNQPPPGGTSIPEKKEISKKSRKKLRLH